MAALLLAFLVGPLRREGWRCGVASLSREKAGELRGQVEAIALASGLQGVKFWKRGAPAITTEGRRLYRHFERRQKRWGRKFLRLGMCR